jgi:hypothetical protein
MNNTAPIEVHVQQARELAERIADALVDDEEDYDLDEVVNVVKALRPFSRDAASMLAEMFELCPVHLCDVQICIDDKSDCQE